MMKYQDYSNAGSLYAVNINQALPVCPSSLIFFHVVHVAWERGYIISVHMLVLQHGRNLLWTWFWMASHWVTGQLRSFITAVQKFLPEVSTQYRLHWTCRQIWGWHVISMYSSKTQSLNPELSTTVELLPLRIIAFGLGLDCLNMAQSFNEAL